jgi:hypothetical protein
MVNTGASGLADITFPDGTGLRLEKNSQFVLKEARGRTYIKPDGTPGTALEWLAVDLKSGKMFGALATGAEANNNSNNTGSSGKTAGVQARAMDLGNLSENLVRTAAAAAKPLPWWQQSGVKRTKVKVDMPTGVAAIRGTFWDNKVNPDGSFVTTLLTGSAEITAGGQTVDLNAGQRTEVAASGAPPAPPAPLTTEDKKEWVAQKEWAQERAQEIKAKQEQELPPPTPAEKPEQPTPPQQPQTQVPDQQKSPIPTDIISIVESALTSVEQSAASVTVDSGGSSTSSGGGTTGGTSSSQTTIRISSVERTSVSSTGVQANDTSGGGEAASAISKDGRYIAFYSNASNLVTSDTNTASDIFVRDRVYGTTVRVSVASNGTQGNSGSRSPNISADGRYVVFSSGASNLVAGDTNGSEDVFVHDRDTDNDGIYDEPEFISTTRVNIATDGTQTNSGSFSSYPSISADGRYVTFYSDANTLVPNDTNGVYDVFVHDMQAETTQRVSVSTAGDQANANSYFPSISPNGRYVVYTSGATTLVPGVSDFGIFVRDLVYNTTSYLLANASDPIMSFDGR